MRYRSAALLVTTVTLFATLIAPAQADDTTIGPSALPQTFSAQAGYAPWDGWLTGSWCVRKAGSCFVGIGRLGDDTRVLRVDPEARRNQAGTGDSVGYKPVRQRSSLPKAGPGTRPAPAADVACVAWLSGEYMVHGPQSSSALNQAALDMASRHLLYGGKWGLTGKLGRRAMNLTEHRKAIQARADQMLSECRIKRGPYKLQTAAPRSVVEGQKVDLTSTLRSAPTGFTPASHPVTVTRDGKSVVLRTNNDGVARHTWTSTEPGATAVAVTTRVRPHTVGVRAPMKGARTRVIVRQPWLTLTQKVTVNVKERAKVSDLSCKRDVVDVDAPVRCAFTYRGYDRSAERVVKTRLYGPFRSERDADCSGEALRKKEFKVAKDGRYDLPRPGADLQLNRPGWYLWSVDVKGNALNTPASNCGAVFRVRR